MSGMRSEWFEHVRKTRSKMSTKKNPCSHRDAMRKASETWQKTKSKILRRRAREQKSKPGVVAPPQVAPPTPPANS